MTGLPTYSGYLRAAGAGDHRRRLRVKAPIDSIPAFISLLGNARQAPHQAEARFAIDRISSIAMLFSFVQIQAIEAVFADGVCMTVWTASPNRSKRVNSPGVFSQKTIAGRERSTSSIFRFRPEHH